MDIPECEQAFQTLKETLTSAPLLQFQDFKCHQFLRKMDPSTCGLRCGPESGQLIREGTSHLLRDQKSTPQEVSVCQYWKGVPCNLVGAAETVTLPALLQLHSDH